MNWIKVAAEPQGDSSIRVFHVLPGEFSDPDEYYRGYAHHLTNNEPWVLDTGRLIGFRYTNVAMFRPAGYQVYFVRPADIPDPYFWTQPFDEQWLTDLKHLLGK